MPDAHRWQVVEPESTASSPAIWVQAFVCFAAALRPHDAAAFSGLGSAASSSPL